jgi:hypothetical protein
VVFWSDRFPLCTKCIEELNHIFEDTAEQAALLYQRALHIWKQRMPSMTSQHIFGKDMCISISRSVTLPVRILPGMQFFNQRM